MCVSIYIHISTDPWLTIVFPSCLCCVHHDTQKKVQLEDKKCRSKSLHPEDPPLAVIQEKWPTGNHPEEKKLYGAITRR